MNAHELQLQPRLRLLADLVPQNARLVDVGTDHGYLPVWLLRHDRIQSAIAADIGREPLLHAQRTAAQYGVTKGLRFLLCDGLCGIGPEEADTVVIAGMGGETIVHILSQAPWTKDGCLLLLQPMTKQELLRCWLNENGYTQLGERLVRDKNYLYPVFSVRGGPQRALTEAEIYGGVSVEGDPLAGEYLLQRAEKLRTAAEGLSRSQREEDRQRSMEQRRLAALLEERRSHL